MLSYTHTTITEQVTMGLMLRYNLFRDVTASAVYGTLLNFYAGRGRPLQHRGTDDERIDVYHADHGWVLVALDSGWEWNERRQAQLYISQHLGYAGLLVFVYDGDYWGYELFNRGVVLDQFTQERSGTPIGFPNRPTQGNARIVVEHLPFLHEADVAPYLVQKHDWQIPSGANIKARPRDEYNRFDECAMLDFLRMLGVRVSIQNGYVQLTSLCYGSLWKRKSG